MSKRAEQYRPAHYRERRAPARDTRSSPSARGYDWKWRKFAKRYRRLNPRCHDCDDLATEIHHVEPVSARPDLKFEPSNLLPLCRACHQRRTNAGE